MPVVPYDECACDEIISEYTVGQHIYCRYHIKKLGNCEVVTHQEAAERIEKMGADGWQFLYLTFWENCCNMFFRKKVEEKKGEHAKE